MPDTSMIVYEEEFRQLDAELRKLYQQAIAKAAFLVDQNGQLIASVGETQNLDTTSLASLTAGNIAAAGGMANLIGEKEFSILFHEGEKGNIHITLIGRAILVIIFDQRSSLGLVRLRVKKSTEVFSKIFDRIQQKVEKPAESTGPGETTKPIQASPFSEITEDDIERLFGKT
jgi:predicted regulator of Ras-like GTPase activity (Roadblock/LC7/MglB family)